MLSSLALAHEFLLGSAGCFITKCLDYLHAHLPELAASLQGQKGICMGAAARSLATLPPAESAAMITSLLEVAGTAQAQLKRRLSELERAERGRADAEAEVCLARKRVTAYQQAVNQVLSGPAGPAVGMRYAGYEGSHYESMRCRIHDLASKDDVYVPRATAGVLDLVFYFFFFCHVLCSFNLWPPALALINALASASSSDQV